MATFRLLAGYHATGKGPARKLLKKGSYVVSDTDLERKFGSKKFRKISNDNLVDKEARNNDPTNPPPRPAKEPNDALEEMTKAQLEQLAEEEEIDLGSARNKTEMIARIRASR